MGGTVLSINLWGTLTINGLAMGMIYAMIAMGLIMLIKAVGILNFAQGDLLTFGTYLACTMITEWELPAFEWVPLAVILWGLTGVAFMFITYWPLRNASYAVAPIVATMGASLVLSEGVLLIWGAFPRTMPSIIVNDDGRAATVRMFNSEIQVQLFLTIGLGALLMFIVYFLTEKLYVGKMMKAAAQDKYAARLIGIPPMLTTALTYILVTILISAAGYMVSPVFSVTKNLSSLQLKAFAGTVIGGFGSIKGAIIGCLIVGLIEAFAQIDLSLYKEAVVFFALIVFLIVRPGGIIKTKIQEKA